MSSKFPLISQNLKRVKQFVMHLNRSQPLRLSLHRWGSLPYIFFKKSIYCLLFNIVSKGLPWPLGNFENKRSYLSVENFCFVVKQLIEREDIPSGIYNLADDIPLSTNELVQLIAQSNIKKIKIYKFNKKIIRTLFSIGSLLKLPYNLERLQKLTENYVVSNNKIKSALGKPLPISSKNGILITLNSFKQSSK
jgi:nucleoside-diphosphate-sugar epimerase